MTMDKEVTERGGEKLENLLFNCYFLNWDISLNIHFLTIKLYIFIENI